MYEIPLTEVHELLCATSHKKHANLKREGVGGNVEGIGEVGLPN